MRHLQLLQALREDLHTRVHPDAITAHRDRQHLSPVFRSEPFNSVRVLVRTDGSDDWKCEVAVPRFDAHRLSRD
ncbi:hypothetical protein A8144_13850 [Mycobacterium leprae 3125609]|uniref:U1764ad n=1 Tax=Mycobacterium leprae TaxID=1769 RepID=Q50014_MYCLR|nr:u1764ad [Mycobacterium leprae]OAR19621.1 hypothetical protein A8144_13850 [Mycobacterium leprae 3125609]OAX70137.1 hypothetical protein A3216_13775 [Mycobacterium leprae 7935681]